MATTGSPALDARAIRAEFPMFVAQRPDGRPLHYLDSAATSQKPQVVLDAMNAYYRETNANVHRGVYEMAAEATDRFESGRTAAARLINHPREALVLTKNATEAINLVAWAWGARELREGDEIVVTEMEHHSNIVSWQLACERSGAELRWFGLTDEGQLDLSNADQLVDEHTKVLAFTWVSNMLGTINPVVELSARARSVGALSVIDASQAAPQLQVDVQAVGCDFLVFTGHKVCGPTGIGVLWGREELLNELPPFHGGGEMIETVTMARSTFAKAPHRFEAGTPPIVEAVGLGAAVDYLGHIGLDAIHRHEQAITGYALEGLQSVKGLTVLGPLDATARGGAISFELDGVHPHDIAQVLDSRGIAVRAGHHCAKPAHARFGVQSSTRMSSYLYTEPREIDALVEALEYTRSYFKLD